MSHGFVTLFWGLLTPNIQSKTFEELPWVHSKYEPVVGEKLWELEKKKTIERAQKSQGGSFHRKGGNIGSRWIWPYIIGPINRHPGRARRRRRKSITQLGQSPESKVID